MFSAFNYMWPFGSNKAANKRLERALKAWRDPRAVRNRASKCRAEKLEAQKCVDAVKAANPLEFYGNRTRAGQCAGQVDLIHDYPDEFARYKHAPGGLQKLKQEMVNEQIQKLRNLGENCGDRPPRRARPSKWSNSHTPLVNMSRLKIAVNPRSPYRVSFDGTITRKSGR